MNLSTYSGLASPLVSRLSGVIHTGEGRWSARCPAHDDKSPSLSVRDAGERVLFHCHAGCNADDILAAIGLSWTDLYPDRWEAAKRSAFATAGKRSKPMQRLLYCGIDVEVERTILRFVAADLRNGRTLTIEDRARAEVARLRVQAADAELREVAA